MSRSGEKAIRLASVASDESSMAKAVAAIALAIVDLANAVREHKQRDAYGE